MTPTAHSAEHRAEENRKAFLAFYDAFNRHDTGAMREIVAPDYVEHEQGPPGISTTGRQGVIDWAESMWAGMPDVAFHVHDVLSDGDRVAGRITVTGTHTEPLWGIPPPGRKAHFDALGISRVTPDRGDPGSTSSTGASSNPVSARNAATSASVATGSATTGWPTKSHSIPAASI